MPDATMTLTLAAFLEARLAEDEAVARRAQRNLLMLPQLGRALTAMGEIVYDPARVLAEVASKRAIMAEHRLIADPARLVKVWRDPTPGVACERCANDPLGDAPLEDIGPCDTWLHLAAVYSDHPDYRDEWSVS